MALWVSPVSSLLLTLYFLHIFGLNDGLVPGPDRSSGPFLRSKRANSFLFEEVLPGNLERECWEEKCDLEEAREVFENNHLTAKFWATYSDGDQCESAPCANGGNCTDQVGGFYCTCAVPFYGETCELGPVSRFKPVSVPNTALQVKDLDPDPGLCQTSGPSSCEQLCTASEFGFSCSCLTGFKLRSDKRSCQPQMEFSCGQIPDQSNSTLCTNHSCPWQVLVLDSHGVPLCWGSLLGPSLVLTSAQCLQSQMGQNLDPDQIFILPNGQRRALQVRSIDIHNRFSLTRHDYDLALLHTTRPLALSSALFHLCVPTHRDHAENVLMHHLKDLLVGGAGASSRSVTLEACRQHASHDITNKMYCLETRRRFNQVQLGQNKDQPGLNKGQLGPNRVQPGLHREQPGVNQDQPGLNKDQPGLNQDQPVLNQDQPVLNQDQPGLNKDQPSINQNQQVLNQNQPGLNKDQPSLKKDQLGPNRALPGLHHHHPMLNQDQPVLNQDQPGLNKGQLGPNRALPGLHHEQPGLHQDQPVLNQDQPVLNQDQPVLKQDQPGLNKDQPGINHDQPGLNPDPPQLSNSRLHRDQQMVDLDFRQQRPDWDRLRPRSRPRPRPQPSSPAHPQPHGQPLPPVLLGGAPLVSVHRGIAYLVGLLTSTAPAEGDTQILVFTKLSRHMTWLQQRLSHMTPPAL